ncbi:MAG: hypothetical protein IT385_29760 [Deltaproteobacteria bacterium]|nr:hypothetical protein [Deltaproteobacteria bacterium]
MTGRRPPGRRSVETWAPLSSGSIARRLGALAAVILVWLSWALSPGIRGAEPTPPVVRAVLFASQECPACQETKRSVLPPIEARFGDRLELRQLDLADRESFVALTTIAARLGIPPKDHKIPFLVVGERALIGLGRIRDELPGLVEAGLAAGGIPWPPEVAPPAPSAPREGAPAPPIHLLWIHQTGCANCGLGYAALGLVREAHPELVVEELNIYDDPGRVQLIGRRVGRETVTVPAAFVGDEALIGPEEVTLEGLEALVKRHAAGAPRSWAEIGEAESRAAAIERFETLGPLAVIAAGLVDGINPCAFATLIFFVSYLTVAGRRGRQVLVTGGAFTLGVFLAYLAVGLGLYHALEALGGALHTAGRVVLVITAVACGVLAVLSVRDYLKARKGDLEGMTLTLPKGLHDRIHAVIRRGRRARAYVAVAFVTGVVVSLLELACTGQIYLPTIIFMTSVPEARGEAIANLVLYNVFFVVPLIVVFVMVYYGTTSQKLTAWFRRRAAVVKLGMASFFTLMAVWMLVSMA